MDLEALRNLNVLDVIILGICIAAFVIGFIQGVIRELLGLAVWLISFLLAANLAIPTGNFLGGYWSTFSHPYSQMVGFLILYVAFLVIGNIIVFVMYKRAPMTSRWAFADEVLGGLLGVGLALLVIAGGIAILDTFYQHESIATTTEVPILHSLSQAMQGSKVVGWFEGSLVKAVPAILSLLIPADLRSLL